MCIEVLNIGGVFCTLCFWAVVLNHILWYHFVGSIFVAISAHVSKTLEVSEAHHCKVPGRCSHHFVPQKRSVSATPCRFRDLLKQFCNSPQLRTRLLEGKTLLAWPKPALVGVINKSSLSLNIEVMKILGEIWCPQWTGPITTPVALQKQQAT